MDLDEEFIFEFRDSSYQAISSNHKPSLLQTDTKTVLFRWQQRQIPAGLEYLEAFSAPGGIRCTWPTDMK